MEGWRGAVTVLQRRAPRSEFRLVLWRLQPARFCDWLPGGVVALVAPVLAIECGWASLLMLPLPLAALGLARRAGLGVVVALQQLLLVAWAAWQLQWMLLMWDGLSRERGAGALIRAFDISRALRRSGAGDGDGAGLYLAGKLVLVTMRSTLLALAAPLGLALSLDVETPRELTAAAALAGAGAWLADSSFAALRVVVNSAAGGDAAAVAATLALRLALPLDVWLARAVAAAARDADTRAELAGRAIALGAIRSLVGALLESVEEGSASNVWGEPVAARAWLLGLGAVAFSVAPSANACARE
jgi:hypothetical protein